MPVALDSNQTVAVDYLELVQTVPLRPISSLTAHKKAVRMLKQLGVIDTMNADQSDYFKVLEELAEDFERTRWPIDSDNVPMLDILQSFLDDHGMTASDLGRLLGERTIGHKVLSGKRKLTTAQVKILADHFRVSTDLFIE